MIANRGHTEGVMVFNATFNNISVILLWTYSMHKLPFGFFLQVPFLTTDQHIWLNSFKMKLKD